MVQIELADEFINDVKGGWKTTTCRKGMRDYPIGPAELVAAKSREIIPIEIRNLSHIKMVDVTDHMAEYDGFSSAMKLYQRLLQFYPDMTIEDMDTIVKFKLRK